MEVRGVEYVRHGDSEGAEDDEEETYTVSSIVDLERWVRDLIAEALPAQAALSRRLPRALPRVRGGSQRRSRDIGTSEA